MSSGSITHCYHCVIAENVPPANRNLLPSDHLVDVQPQTPANIESIFKEPCSLKQIRMMPLTSARAASDPKQLAIKAVEKNPKQVYIGECQKGILS